MKYVNLIFGVVLMLVLVFALWNLGRQLNYSLSYESMVKETIREMVKKEALK